MGYVWWSIEVRDGIFSAHRWRDAHSQAIIEAAVTHGARTWEWFDLPWGLVLEIAFDEHDGAEAWLRFRGLPAITAALDAVRDPVSGLYIYPGRGGSAGAGRRRHRPEPLGAGAAELPTEPEPVIVAHPADPGTEVEAPTRAPGTLEPCGA